MSSISQEIKRKRRQYIQTIIDKIVAKIGQDNTAYIFITISALLYPLCYVYISMNNFNPLQYNIARGASNFVYGIIVAHYFGIDMDFKHTQDNKYLMKRTIIIFIQQISYIFMHYVVSISILNILSLSSIIFSFLLDYYLYDSKITKNQILGIIIGYLGIIITTNHQYLMTIIDPSYIYKSKFQHYIIHDVHIKILFSFIFLIVTCFWSYALILQKKIKNYSSLQINHFMNICFILFSATLYPNFVSNPITLISFLKGFLISGSLVFFTNTLFTSGFGLSKKTGILTLLTSCTVITSCLVSIFVYDEKINVFSATGIITLAYGLIKVVLS